MYQDSLYLVGSSPLASLGGKSCLRGLSVDSQAFQPPQSTLVEAELYDNYIDLLGGFGIQTIHYSFYRGLPTNACCLINTYDKHITRVRFWHSVPAERETMPQIQGKD